MTSPSLHNLWRRGCDYLGCDLAIMGGAMTWVSERNLVAAISNGGGFGVLPPGAQSADLLAAEVRAPRRRPFRRQPDPHAPSVARPGRGLPRPPGRARRARRRAAAGRRDCAHP